MSWNVSASANRHAIDGHVRLMFATARRQIDGHPASEAALRVHHTAVEDFLRVAPFHSYLVIESHGHFNHDGTGQAELTLKIGTERTEPAAEAAAAEPSVTPEEALLEHHPDT